MVVEPFQEKIGQKSIVPQLMQQDGLQSPLLLLGLPDVA